MRSKFKCLLVVILLYCVPLCAEQSSTSFFSAPQDFSVSNFFIETGGGLCAPIQFFNQGIIPMTGNGYHYLTGIGVNLEGWLLGIAPIHDIWGESLEAQGLMEIFKTNIIEFRVRRIISEQNISFLPSWLEIVPGFGFGAYFISTDYYPSLRAKQEGKLKSIGWGDAGTNCFYYRISLELSFPIGNEIVIPFAGVDYNAFYDESIGGGFAGYSSVYLGLRVYPINVKNTISTGIRNRRLRKLERQVTAVEIPEDSPIQGGKIGLEKDINSEDAPEYSSAGDDSANNETDELTEEQSEAEETNETLEDIEEEEEIDVSTWSAPEVSLQINPDTDFTPDKDGVHDEATIIPSVNYLQYPPEKWDIKIYDKQKHLIRTFSGEGELPESILWDGKTDDNEDLISKNIYTAKLTVIPDERDVERTSVNKLEAEDAVETGILFHEIIPEKQWKIIVNTIYFDPDKATFNKISEEQRKANNDTLDSIAYQLSLRENVNVVVQGYANNVSNTERENINELIPLSRLRANTIMELLIKRGLDSSILESEGLGGANPIAAWEDRENWWKNRRVEFIVTKIDEE